MSHEQINKELDAMLKKAKRAAKKPMATRIEKIRSIPSHTVAETVSATLSAYWNRLLLLMGKH